MGDEMIQSTFEWLRRLVGQNKPLWGNDGVDGKDDTDEDRERGRIVPSGGTKE